MTDKEHDVINQFDEILFMHLKRLIGSRYDAEASALNSFTISLITLLMERENEMESFASGGTDRYTSESLTEDVTDLGIDTDQDMNVFIEDLIQRDYIQIDGGRLVPQKSAINAARLLDMVFPKMPGMNLVAYFVQTIDEVKSNRKDIDSAKCQFDQILHMQGIPLEKGLPDKKFKTPETFSPRSSNNVIGRPRSSSNEAKVLSPDAYKGKAQITKLNFGEPRLTKAEPDGIPPDGHEAIDDDTEPEQSNTEVMTIPDEPEDTVLDEPVQCFDISAEKIPERDSILTFEDASGDHTQIEKVQSEFCDRKDDFSANASFQKQVETATETVEKKSDAPRNDKEDSPVNDDDIEQRIADFEEDLALECPLCRQSKITVKHTATGKSYYKCSNQGCSFISWGKPHHILCPECHNPFLIETSNKAGARNLKCPRATCRYRKKMDPDMPVDRKERMDSTTLNTGAPASMAKKPRRRIVRRRVVRRKR